MFHDNITALRKLRKMTQEEVAERVGVSRQALAKWESGDTLPDIERTRLLAEVFEVSLDELVNYEAEPGGLPVPPRGKHVFGVVTLGDKGQIVIPRRARKIFGLEPGDSVIVLGDEAQGLALIREKDFSKMVSEVRKAAGN